MYCPHCGTHNEGGMPFCQNCGADLQRFDRPVPCGWWPGMFIPSVQDRKWAVRMALLAPIVTIFSLVVGLPLLLWFLYLVVRYLIF